MKTRRMENIMEAFAVLLFGIFAMPFFGGYLMLDKNTETKCIGGILLIVGLVIWFMYGLH